MSRNPSAQKHTAKDLPFVYYKVGGAVRDFFLQKYDNNITIKERDWVVIGSSSKQMLALGFTQVGKNFPVFLHPKTKEEYALARLEKKQGKGYHGFVFDTAKSVTLEEDLLRRDLTINAIAQDPTNPNKFIDPYNGIEDIHNKQLRHISNAFEEDPLRVFRVARFYARFAYLGFTVAPSTIKKMQSICQSGELNNLSAERIWQETQLALQTRSPQLFFHLLHKIGGLKDWFPEIQHLFGVPQPARWHPEIDCGIHSLLVLEHATKMTTRVAIRFCALTHDLGKGTTPQAILPSHHGHEQRGVKLVENLCERLKIPKHIRNLAKLSARWHTHFHHRYQEMKADTYLKVLTAIKYFQTPQSLEDLLIISESDSKGRTGFRYTPYPSKHFWYKIAEKLSQFEQSKPYNHPDFQQLNNEQKKQTIKQQRIAIIQHVLDSKKVKNRFI